MAYGVPAISDTQMSFDWSGGKQNAQTIVLTTMANSLLSMNEKISEMVGMMKDSFNLEKLEAQREELARRDAKLKAGETQKAPAAKAAPLLGISGMLGGLGEAVSGPWGKVALLVGALSGLFLLSDSIVPVIAGIVEFMKFKFIPGIQDLHDRIMSTDTGYLGIAGAAGITGVTFAALKTFFSTTGTKVATAIGNIWKGNKAAAQLDLFKKSSKIGDAFSDLILGIKNISISVKAAFPSTLAKGLKNVGGWLGTIGNFIKNLFSSMTGIATTTLKLLPGAKLIIKFGVQFAKFFGPLGLILQAIIGVFSAVKGAVEGYKEGGVPAAITGAMKGLWDGLIGSVLNMFASVLSWILDKLGMEKAAAWLKELDFSADSIWNFFTVTIPGYIGDLVKWFTDLFPSWEDLKAVFVSALNFTGAIGWLWSKISGPLKGLISWFGELLPSWEDVKTSLLAAINFYGDVGSWLWQKVSAPVKGLMEWFGDLLPSWDGIKAQLAIAIKYHPAVWLWNKISEPLSGLVAWFGSLLPSWDEVKAKLGVWGDFNFGDWLGSKLSNLMMRITGVFTSMINGLKSGVNVIIDKASKWSGGLVKIPKFEIGAEGDFSADDTTTLPTFTTTGTTSTAELSAVEAEQKAAIMAAMTEQGQSFIQSNAYGGDQANITTVSSADLSAEHSDPVANEVTHKMRGMGGG